MATTMSKKERIFRKYRALIILMSEFFADMEQNDRKDTRYSDIKLKRLLEETEILRGKTV